MTAVSGTPTFAGRTDAPINADSADLAGVDALAADGAIVRIRPVRADDAAALTDLHERASNDTLYRRFLWAGHHPIADEIARLVRPLFGPVLTCGVRGVATELLGDRSRRVLPLTDVDAARMWRDLKAAAPMLTGYRGSEPVDTDALEDLLLRLGRLAEDLPEVATLGLDPVIVGPAGAAVVDVKVRLAAVGREPDPGLRALCEPK